MGRGIEKGSYIHVVKRGARGLPIVNDSGDRLRFLRILNYLNDRDQHENWGRDILQTGARDFSMPWPENWNKKDPLVQIHAYTLMTNHFHLLLEEITEGGVAKFMRNISDSMTKGFNEKYNQKGSLFQGPYQSKIVTSEEYLRFLVIYILVKNPFELYSRGFNFAIKNFDIAFSWAKKYQFCSLADLLSKQNVNPILDGSTLSEIFESEKELKEVAEEALSFMQDKKQRYQSNFLEY